jgi:N-methylhydantoinase A
MSGKDDGSVSSRAFVGVDVGGTHTDVHVHVGSDEARGKALTTYDDFSRGVLDALRVAAETLDLSLDDLLSRTDLLVNATTVVTNAVAQLRGSKVGVLTTAGFGDELRFAGGPRLRNPDDHVQTNVPDLVDRRDIVEIDGRIDYAGKELVPLDVAAVKEAARFLVEERGVSAIAICFLSSYINDAQEAAAEKIVNEAYPEIFTTPSHSVSGVRGEAVRWMTAVLNCFVFEDAENFLDTLSTKLNDAGLAGRVAFFQGLGGGISKERAGRLPLALLGAGPAAGATGSNQLARTMGHSRVLVGDMGGTSFDTGLIYDNVVHVEKAVRVGRFRTAMPLVDVISVGAGGGSIAWIGERGVPQVGPRSAGSTPGPAAYGNGGTEPTVTDAMVAMDLIDPDNYLGGRLAIRKDLAIDALREKLADRLDWSVEDAAAAVYDLVVANMANAVREVSVAHGYDPRDFVFYAYGGTLPWFAAEIARTLNIARVLIPNNSSVFCARGLLASDFVLRYDQTVQSGLDSEESLGRINELYNGMIETGRDEMRREGFADDAIVFDRTVDMQFAGQVHALPIAIPDRELTAGDVPELQQRFNETYERTYGAGTAWPGAIPQALNVAVTVMGKMASHEVNEYPDEPSSPEEMLKVEREVYLPSNHERVTVPIYDEAKFTPGSSIAGPAVVEAVDTTLYVPEGTVAERDRYLNVLLTVGGNA